MRNLYSLAIPLILSILYIPVAYSVAIIMAYELMFIRVSLFQDKCSKMELLRRKWLIFKACGLSWKKINNFEKYYVHRLYSSMQGDEFLSEINDFKSKRSFMREINNFSEGR